MPRAALVLIGMVAALLLVEVTLRLVDAVPEVANPLYSFHDSDPVLGWRGRPDVRLRFRRPQFDVEIAHDAAGWRLPDPPPPAEPEQRVLVLGDSFTWGWGVPQGAVYTDDQAPVIYRDIARTAEELARNHPADGDNWMRLFDLWQQVKDRLLARLFSPFPPVRGAAGLVRTLGTAETLRLVQLLMLPVGEMARRLFAGDAAVCCFSATPCTPTSRWTRRAAASWASC